MSAPDRMELQRSEFDAADEFAKQVRRIQMTAVVDDDYPEVRHDYESALRDLLKACEANGRHIETRAIMKPVSIPPAEPGEYIIAYPMTHGFSFMVDTFDDIDGELVFYSNNHRTPDAQYWCELPEVPK